MALFSTRTGLGLASPGEVGVGRWVALTLAVSALIGIAGCVEETPADEGTPSITIIASNACGKNVLPVATVDDLTAGTIRAMDVIITGTDPASGNRNLVGEGGEPVAVVITAAARGDSNGRGFLVSSRSGGASFGSVSKDLTFSGRNARDQFFCVAAGSVDLTAVVENYRPGGTGAPIAELATRAAFPVRCVPPSEYFTECGNVADATVIPEVEMGVDGGDAGDAGDAGTDADAADAEPLAAWTVSFVPFTNGEDAVIAIRNSGGSRPDTVEVSFRVTESGQPVPNVPVTFSVIGASAGAELLPEEVTTNAEGIAATRLVAGNIPGTIQVKATAKRVGPDDEVQEQSVNSRSIVIRGGIPSARTLQLTCDDSILLAFRARIETPERLNERFIYDLPARPGTKCRVTMGDRLQGRLDRDTRVFFLTEAGTVDQEVGIDEDGVGEIEHRISVPVPADVDPLEYEEPFTLQGGEVTMNPRDGLVRIVAFTRGEEDFADNDADGLFTNVDSLLPGMDLAEPYVDADDDDSWTQQLGGNQRVSETFRDTNQNRIWNGPNNIWDQNTEIWTSTTVLWVGEPAPIGPNPQQNGLKIEDCDRGFGCASPDQAPFNPVCASAAPTLHLDYQGSQYSVRFRMRDHNGNCTGGGGARLEIGPLGSMVRVGGSVSPFFLAGPNCFSGFERPGAPDPVWTLALPPQDLPAPDEFGTAEVSFIAHFGSIQNNGDVGAATLTSTVRGCY